MDFFSLITLLGGLALFLYGMNVMSDGLAKISGGKMEQILENLTSNPIKAVLLGAGVTAVTIPPFSEPWQMPDSAQIVFS